MIFSLGLHEKVLSRGKTQTRRLKRGIYQAGGIYAIQSTRGGGTLGYIHILRIWPQRIIDVSEHEARAEGFDTIAEWFAVMCKVNRKRSMRLLDSVWAFEFELVGSKEER